MTVVLMVLIILFLIDIRQEQKFWEKWDEKNGYQWRIYYESDNIFWDVKKIV